jgi:hypothetical protein
MSEGSIAESGSATTGSGEVGPGDLVACGGAVYHIPFHRSDRNLIVEAENSETFERVPLTAAAILTGSPNYAAAKKRRHSRDGR